MSVESCCEEAAGVQADVADAIDDDGIYIVQVTSRRAGTQLPKAD